MLRGNTAICNGSFSFSWDYVDQIELHNGSKYNWSPCGRQDIHVVIGPDISNIIIDGGMKLKCVTSQDQVNIHSKSRQLLMLVPHLFTNTSSIRQYCRPVSLTEDSDSGGEQVDEPALDAAFNMFE